MFAFFHRFRCLHREWTLWHTAVRVLVSHWYGRTEDEVQQRECLACGYVQRAEIPAVKK